MSSSIIATDNQIDNQTDNQNSSQKNIFKMIKIHHDDYYGLEMFNFKLDGKKLQTEGSFGGCPEDNSRGRDYYWVEELLKEVMKRVGYEFVFEDESK